MILRITCNSRTVDKHAIEQLYSVFQLILKEIYGKFYIQLDYRDVFLSIRPVSLKRIKYEITRKCGESWEFTWDIKIIEEE